MEKKKFDHRGIELKWQKRWKESKLYRADDLKDNKEYILVELAYTSGDLHIGHWFGWTAPDVYGRYRRMNGANVLFPVGGFDSFGLPAENAAIKHGTHPKAWTDKNINNMRSQFETMGPSFDWEKEVITSDPEYYRWTQWLFLQMFKNNLAYKDKVTSNWCTKCKTVLANEHVQNGCCWRHTNTQVQQKKVEQWLFAITKYANKLIWPEKPNVSWPKSIIQGQNNWIGKKKGINIRYKIEGLDDFIECWTSRPDTNYGATFIVLAPEHVLASRITTNKYSQKVKKYIKTSLEKTERDRLVEGKEKTGVFTGRYAINGLNGKRMPIWVSDFVLASFGTGAVVGVPGHDKRDFEFAKKYKLPIRRVVVGIDGDTSEIKSIEQVQEEGGRMVNSGFLNDLDISKAIKKMMDYIEEKGWGKRKIKYHIRDWTISRQRYWGAPIPIIYCRKCWNVKCQMSNVKYVEGKDYAVIDGEKHYIHTVPEKDLPVKLPEKVDYTPTGKAPLATATEFVNTKCPKCGRDAKRETETMDTYVDSSWYFFRYPGPNYSKGPFNKRTIDKWMPISIYFGGPEHILGHTLYARFITKVLYDLGYIKFDEFAERRFNHGIILGSDGYRMSKSQGNVVNPDYEVEKYGADAVRLYLCFLGPHDQGGPWVREGIEGMRRFIEKVWQLSQISNFQFRAAGIASGDARPISNEKKLLRKMHQTIKKVTEDIENLKFNTAIAAIMEYVNELRAQTQNSKLEGQNHNLKFKTAKKTSNQPISESNNLQREAIKTLVLLMAPFTPHLAEEVWVKVLGEKFSIHKAQWPKHDTKYMKVEQVEIVVQVNGRLRATLNVKTQNSNVKSDVIKIAKEDEKVKKWIVGKKIKKEIFVPGKLVNFVVG